MNVFERFKKSILAENAPSKSEYLHIMNIFFGPDDVQYMVWRGFTVCINCLDDYKEEALKRFF